MSRNMKKIVSGILVAIMLLALIPQGIVFAAGNYSDTKGHWAEAAIDTWSGYGILLGYPEGNFLPGNGISRAEMAAIINRVMSYTQRADSNTFSDVTMDKWFADDILKLNAAGIILGTGGKASPNEKISRQEAVTMMARAFDIYDETSRTNFTDENSIDSWALPYVRGMKAKGYITGYTDGSFSPRDVLTRAEVVTILNNIIKEFINISSTYGTSTRTTTVVGNVVISEQDVTLLNYDIIGDLYIAQGVDRGDVTLNGTSVTGNVYVWGGGSSSITIKNCTIGGVTLNSASTRVVASGTKITLMDVIKGTFEANDLSNITTLNMKNGTSTTLTGRTEVGYIMSEGGTLVIDSANVNSVIAASTAINVRSNGNVDKITINQGSGSSIINDGKIGELTSSENITVSGSGTVEKSNISSSGSSEGGAITLKSVEADGNASSLTTKLKLTFDKDITNITANDIIISMVNNVNTGATKGTITKVANSIGVYELTLNNITSSGSINVSFNKFGYTPSADSTKTVSIFYAQTVTSVVSRVDIDGDANYRTSKITVTLSDDIPNLNAMDFKINELATTEAEYTGAIISGFNKIVGSTGIYELTLSNIVRNGNITLSLTKSGYTFTTSTATTAIKMATYTSSTLSVRYNANTLTPVTYDLTQDGNLTSITTKLILKFNQDIDITASNITITNGTGTDAGSAAKGTINVISKREYELTVTPTKTGIINVSLTAPSGYTFSPAVRSVTVYRPDTTTASFKSAVNTNTTTETTTKIRLEFDKDITGLAIGDITITQVSTDTGATRLRLERQSEGIYDLTISGVKATGDIRVNVTKSGYSFSPTYQTVRVYYGNESEVTFISAVADGAAGVSTSTMLTLTFNQDIKPASVAIGNGTGIATVTGDVIKLSTNVYQVPITVTQAGSITVYATAPTNYTYSPASRSSNVNHSGSTTPTNPSATEVRWIDLETSGIGTTLTTQLIVTFDRNVTLKQSDFTIVVDTENTGARITGISPSSGSASQYVLTLSGITKAGYITLKVANNNYNFIPNAWQSIYLNHTPIINYTFVSATAQETTGTTKETTTKIDLVFSSEMDILAQDFLKYIKISDAGGTGIKIARLEDVYGNFNVLQPGKYTLYVSDVAKPGRITITIDPIQGYNNTHPSLYTDVYKKVVLESVEQDRVDPTKSTTKLTLKFDSDITGLTANDIIITTSPAGAITNKGTPSSKGKGVYELPVTVTKGGSITGVSIDKEISGYFIVNATPPPTLPSVYCAVNLSSVVADGTATVATTKLTLTFDRDITDPTELAQLLSYISIDLGTAGWVNIPDTSTLVKIASGKYELSITEPRAGSITVRMTAGTIKDSTIDLYNVQAGTRTATVRKP